jgi:ATP-dependent Clp protease ATP-binding subunit ClpB
MNANKFTQKSLEAVDNCQQIAYQYSNPEIDQEHMLYSLIMQEDSLILKLLSKMSINTNAFINTTSELVSKLPKVTGGNLFMSASLNKTLLQAEAEAKAMGDEYVSIEHLFLALLYHCKDSIKKIFKQYQITRDSFLKILSTVRGNQKVTNNNPESTYNVLEKYGYDLVERANAQKLDPVIGRQDTFKEN